MQLGCRFSGMGWFRGQSRLGGWVALVAIALQLALSFGHVHSEALSRASEIAALTVDGSDGGPPDSPVAPHEHGFCSIYAVLSLLAGAQTADAPALPVPAVAAPVTLVAEPGTTRAILGRPAFQSRAPPLA
jgi:hypothetical protein